MRNLYKDFSSKIKKNSKTKRNIYYNIGGGNMSSKYPVLPPNQIINALSKVGFEKTSQKGSHAKYRK